MLVIMLLYGELRTQTFLNIFLVKFKCHSAPWPICVSISMFLILFCILRVPKIFRFYFLAPCSVGIRKFKSFRDLAKGVCARKCFARPPKSTIRCISRRT